MAQICDAFNSRYLIAFDLMKFQSYVSTHVPLRQILTLRIAFWVNHCSCKAIEIRRQIWERVFVILIETDT